MKNKRVGKTPPQLSKNLSLIDTHCHLDMAVYEQDLEDVIHRALNNKIDTIISIGIDVVSSQKAVSLAEKYSHIFATVGIHPHDVKNATQDNYQTIETLITEEANAIVGYGEIGLDYVKNYSEPILQQDHFRRQLDIAQKYNLPVIIHNREADQDTLDILQKHAPFSQGGIMHCFSGDYDFATKILDLGMLLSIPGIVTFKNAGRLHDVVRKVPLSSIVLETDGPFLAPAPYRGKRNEPWKILFTAQRIAELKEITLDEVAQQTTNNARQLFKI